MKTFALAALALLALSTVACAAVPAGEEEMGASTSMMTDGDAITIDNWETHPAIVAITKEVTATDAASYTSETKTMCSDESYGEADRTKLTDAMGVIRKMIMTSTERTSSTTEEFHYDAQGKLRQSAWVVQSIDGAFEWRDYYDTNGKPIWSVSRMVQLGADEDGTPDLGSVAFEDAGGIGTNNENAQDARAVWSAAASCDP